MLYVTVGCYTYMIAYCRTSATSFFYFNIMLLKFILVDICAMIHLLLLLFTIPLCESTVEGIQLYW